MKKGHLSIFFLTSKSACLCQISGTVESLPYISVLYTRVSEQKYLANIQTVNDVFPIELHEPGTFHK